MTVVLDRVVYMSQFLFYLLESLSATSNKYQVRCPTYQVFNVSGYHGACPLHAMIPKLVEVILVAKG